MCVCVHTSAVCLTLPPATADFPEAGSVTQPVEPLLFDQLHDLGLDFLSQLTLEKQKMNTHIHTLLVEENYVNSVKHTSPDVVSRQAVSYKIH